MKWGRLAAPVFPGETSARVFWMSRSNLDYLPVLTDLVALAKAIRCSIT